MFDINREVKRLERLEHAKINGLSYKPRPVNPKVEHISAEGIDNKATQEAVFIKRRFTSRTTDFGHRLRKSSGQDHKRKGHNKLGSFRGA